MAEISKTKVVTYQVKLTEEEMRTLLDIFADVKGELYRKLPEGVASFEKERLMADFGSEPEWVQ